MKNQSYKQIENTIKLLDNDYGKYPIFDNYGFNEGVCTVLQLYLDTEKTELSDKEIEYFTIWIKAYNDFKFMECEDNILYSMYDIYTYCEKDIRYSKQYK